MRLFLIIFSFLACKPVLFSQSTLIATVPERRQALISGSLLVWLEPKTPYPVMGLYDQIKPLLQTRYGVAKGQGTETYDIRLGGQYSDKTITLRNQRCDYTTDGGGCAAYSAEIVTAPKGVYGALFVLVDGRKWGNTVLPPIRPDFMYLVVNIADAPRGKISYETYFFLNGKEVPILEDND